MAQTFMRFFLLSAVITSTLCRTQKDSTDDTPSPQNPLGRADPADIPLTISVQGSATTIHAADIANVEVTISVCQATRQQTLDEAGRYVTNVQNMAEGASFEHVVAAPLTVWGNSIMQEPMPFIRHNNRAYPAAHKRKDGVGDAEDYCAYSSLSIRVDDLNLLPAFAQNITSSSPQIKFGHVK